MRARIHRGTKQIGGSVIELEAQGQRLLLDCGLPLDGDANDDTMLPLVPGFSEPDPSLLGVVISHGHRDHWGLLGRAHAGLPIFVGSATERILNASAFFIRDLPAISAAGHLADGQPLRIGPFEVTPHLVDHSAFDAYALTVKAGGRRLFYSGDIRSHGRKGALFERLVSRPPQGIDVMLMEGSPTCAASTVSVIPASTNGRPGLAAWRCRKPSSCGRLRTRMPSSSACWPTPCWTTWR